MLYLSGFALDNARRGAYNDGEWGPMISLWFVLVTALGAWASEENVILITVDGVRPQEFFDQTANATFSTFWSKYASQGVIFGDAPLNRMDVSNPYLVSLPAYESILAGRVQPTCYDNVSCGRRQVDEETFPERLVRSGIPRSQVATFASWEGLALATEHTSGATVTNAGNRIFVEPDDDDHMFAEIAEYQRWHPSPWSVARWDRITGELALAYLKKHGPRFLYISFTETDEWAHAADAPRLRGALRFADVFFDRLIETLKTMGSYGRNTTILLTTDHSRGDGANWPHHNARYPEAKHIWMYARGPHVRRGFPNGRAVEYSHVDIRPTIETLLGLEPRAWEPGLGRAIPQITGKTLFRK